MKPADWNGLRRGDAVFVHVPGATSHVAEPGLVRFVETGVDRDANSVGIRLDRSEYVVVWPKAQLVHGAVSEPTGSCWRCDGLAPVLDQTPEVRPSTERADHDA